MQRSETPMPPYSTGTLSEPHKYMRQSNFFPVKRCCHVPYVLYFLYAWAHWRGHAYAAWELTEKSSPHVTYMLHTRFSHTICNERCLTCMVHCLPSISYLA